MKMPWPTIALEQIALVQRGKFSARPRNDPKYYGGNIPFIQTGDVANSAGRVCDYSQTLNTDGLSVSKLFPKGSLVITIAANIGDVAMVEFDFACPDSLVVIQPKQGIDRDWLQYSLETKKELLNSLATQNAQKNINLEILRPLTFEVPTFAEQKRIANTIKIWNTAITTTERLIAAKEQCHRGLMQRLLLGTAFPNKELSYLVERVSRKNIIGNDYPLTISGKNGLIPQHKFFDKRIAAQMTESYILLKRGEFAYNKSYSLGYPYGAIKRLDCCDEGIVSSLYLCFCLQKTAKLLSDYLMYFCEAGGFNYQIHQIAQEGARNHGLLNVAVDDFFKMKLPIPDVAHQQRVVEVLAKSEQELISLRKLLSAMYLQKRGLMQKLFSGEWRISAAPIGQDKLHD